MFCASGLCAEGAAEDIHVLFSIDSFGAVASGEDIEQATEEGNIACVLGIGIVAGIESIPLGVGAAQIDVAAVLGVVAVWEIEGIVEVSVGVEGTGPETLTVDIETGAAGAFDSVIVVDGRFAGADVHRLAIAEDDFNVAREGNLIIEGDVAVHQVRAFTELGLTTGQYGNVFFCPRTCRGEHQSEQRHSNPLNQVLSVFTHVNHIFLSLFSC